MVLEAGFRPLQRNFAASTRLLGDRSRIFGGRIWRGFHVVVQDRSAILAGFRPEVSDTSALVPLARPVGPPRRAWLAWPILAFFSDP